MTRYRFGEFEMDVAQRRLAREGEPVVLSPRLFDALLFFVERAGQLLEKETLLAALWPGLIVEENSLSQMVSALRRALNDDAQSSTFLQTVPRRGFRFISPVIVVAPADPVPIGLQVVPEATVASDTAEETVPATSAALPSSADDASKETGDHAQRGLSRRRWLQISAVGSAAVAVGAGAGWWKHAQSLAHPDNGTTLAVLPFSSLVPENRDRLLEVGMADSLIVRLSTLPGVAVRSIGSTRRYAGGDQDPIAAARALDVEWILDGSIQRWGDQVRVTARLLNVRSGEAAWSGNFDERFTNMFDLQDAISLRVSQVLSPRLDARGRKRLDGEGGTRNVDAYQFYLAAQHQAESIRSAGLAKSIALFRQAIAIDPTYALAYTGIAESNRRMIFGADGEPRIVLGASNASTQRAIELDASLASAHSALGWNRFWYDWNWSSAEAAFRRAIVLNPNEVTAHFGLGQLYDSIGRDEDAAAQMRAARELDPLSLITLTLEASALYGINRKDEAMERLRRVFDIEPDFWVAHLTQGALLASEGRLDEARAALVRAERFADGSSQPAAYFGHFLARHGERERAREMAEQLVELERTRYVPPTSYGVIFAGLEDKERALNALEKALAVRDVRLTLMRDDRRWSRALGSEPRYRAVMQAMRFPGS